MWAQLAVVKRQGSVSKLAQQCTVMTSNQNADADSTELFEHGQNVC